MENYFYKSIPLIAAVTLLFLPSKIFIYFVLLFLWGLWSLYTAKDRKGCCSSMRLWF